MTVISPTPYDTPGLALTQAQTVLARQVEALGELAEIGMEIARATGRLAAAAADQTDDQTPEAAHAAPSADGLALAFHRASRAVRLTFMLQAKLLEDLRRMAIPTPWSIARAPVASIDPGLKAHARRVVERLVQATHAEDPAEIDRLMTETAEHLDGEHLYGDLAGRSLAELVASVCRDLGLEPDMALFGQAIWTEVCDEEVGAEDGGDWDDPLIAATGPPDRSEAQILSHALKTLKAYAPDERRMHISSPAERGGG